MSLVVIHFQNLITEAFHRGFYACLTAGLENDNYRFNVEVNAPANSGEDVGVLFRYQNNDNYYRLSINSNRGFTRLEKKVGSTYTTLASNARGYTENQTINISIEAMGPLLQIFINGDPVFSAYDNSLPSGAIGLYSRDLANFDNVELLENDTTPSIVVDRPVAYSVLPDGPLNMQVSAIALNVPENNVAVEIEIDGSLCSVANEVAGEPGKYSTCCNNVPPGEHTITARLLDGFNVVATDTNQAVGIGGSNLNSDRFIAIGDSLTNGVFDNYSADNSTSDNRVISFQGWPATLSELANSSSAFPNIVVNEGIAGDTTTDTNNRINSILERNQNANRALILLGTNDSNPFLNVSTATVKSNLLSIINVAKTAGVSNFTVALIPPTDGDVTRNNNIVSYNTMISTEIVGVEPNVDLGPDFYSCYLNRFSLFDDTLHPNGLGYVMFAQLWKNALDGNPVMPGGPCPAPIYILENINLNGYKQNILEVGDEYYQDSNFVLNNIPNELADGVWIMTQNSDSTNTSGNFLTFDVGSSPVTVYVAYASGTTPPTWLTNNFASVNLSSNLTASGGGVSTFNIWRQNNATETVTLGGNKASGSGGGAIDNYIVIVVN